MDQYSDAQLADSFLKGSEEAFKILAERYLKLVYNIAWQYAENKAAAEDLTQEVFVKVWKNLNRFDRNKSFKAWIAKIAKNTGLDHVKKKQDIPFSLLSGAGTAGGLLESLINSNATLAEEFDRKLLGQKFMEAIEGLPNQTKDVLISKLEADETFDQIASKTGESINTVKSRYRRGIIHLRKLLKD